MKIVSSKENIAIVSGKQKEVEKDMLSKGI